MKKIIIISVSSIVLLFGFVLTYIYITSFHDVNFVIKQTGITADVYNKSNNEKVASVSDTTSKLSLKNGDYYYTVVGENFSKDNYDFNVNNADKEVIINPNYSKDYLSRLLDREKPIIDTLINNTYSDVISDYIIFNGQIFENGKYYGTTIQKKIGPQDVADLYRIVLRKDGENWTIIRYPELVLTKFNYPDVPVEILKSVNSLTSS